MHDSGPSDPTPDYAETSFDDQKWTLVDAPHDMLITQTPSERNDPKQGYIARGAGVYRKHFNLPTQWRGKTIWIYIEGSFHVTNAWFNGKHVLEHKAGYTSFWIRLDDVAPRWGLENVLALQALLFFLLLFSFFDPNFHSPST